MTEKIPINLLKGAPNPELLPIDTIDRAVQHVLQDREIAVQGLLYGPDPGFQPLREELAAWLNKFYKPSFPTTAHRFCITGGASQNLGCLLGVYTCPQYTRNIWIVAPAYFLSFEIFQDAGFSGKLRAVPEDGEGLDIEFLTTNIRRSEEEAVKSGNTHPVYKSDRPYAKVYKHIIYCVPSFANPSSRSMSLKRRKDLVCLAREFDALVVADDVYDFLQWPADPKHAGNHLSTAHLPRLVDLEAFLFRDSDDAFGHTCSNGSFSKIAGPGLRVGWVEGTKKFAYGISQAGVQRSGGAPSQLTSTYVSNLLHSGQLQDHIRTRLLPAYAERYAVMLRAIREHLLPLGFTMPQADRDVVGGFFVWLSLPLDMSAVELMTRCADDEGVIIIPGSRFEVPGDNTIIRFPSSIRLCWAWEEASRLTDGVKRIAHCAEAILKDQHVTVRSST